MDFTLRNIAMEDLDALVKHANDPGIAGNLTNKFPYPYKAADGKRFIEFTQSQNPVHVKGIDVSGELVGAIGIHPQEDIFEKNAEMGYWLARAYWGQGIISRAVPLMVEYGFRSFPVNRIFARPFGRNIASQRVLQKSGFVLEAKLEGTIFKNGKFEDEWIFAVRRADWSERQRR